MKHRIIRSIYVNRDLQSQMLVEEQVRWANIVAHEERTERLPTTDSMLTTVGYLLDHQEP